MNECEQHRPYLAALADGETELVPPGTLTHVSGCNDCAQEVDTHRLLGARLRETMNVDQSPLRRRAGRRWLLRLGAVAAAVVVVAGAAAGWHSYTGEDRVTAAVAVASGQTQYRSSDPTAITSWCERTSGRPMREVTLSDLSAEGARTDHRAGIDIVTVTYTTAQGARINISWLDASQAPLSQAGVQTRTIDGRTVLVVTSPSGTAVISGSAPLASLWATAAAVEAGAGATPAGSAGGRSGRDEPAA